jgi:hypothetical protein
MLNGQHLVGQRSGEDWKRIPDGELLPSAAIDDFLINITQIVNLGKSRVALSSSLNTASNHRSRRYLSKLKVKALEL